MPQITARLSPEARKEFEQYAASLGLNGSSLARLLIVRELGPRPNRLSPRPTRRKAFKDPGKLTAHSCSAETIAAFRDFADSRGPSRSAVAKEIFERELREQWLLKAIQLRPRKNGDNDARR